MEKATCLVTIVTMLEIETFYAPEAPMKLLFKIHPRFVPVVMKIDIESGKREFMGIEQGHGMEIKSNSIVLIAMMHTMLLLKKCNLVPRLKNQAVVENKEWGD